MSRHRPYVGRMSTQPEPRIPRWTKADRLRKARETTGMTQREFADHVGISKNTVGNYEAGKTTRFSRPMLAAWAMATGVPIEWLETGKIPAPEGGDGEAAPQPTDWMSVQVGAAKAVA